MSELTEALSQAMEAPASAEFVYLVTYVSLFEDVLTVDGTFTLEELKALVTLMERDSSFTG